jgi:Flp pilus assembly protein TadD
MAHDVFVSYASADKTVADAVCGTLESNAVRCWIAPRDVEPGMAYGEAILDAIQGCRIMVLVFSSKANTSSHIPKEIERAVSKGASIIPFRIEDVKPGKSLDYFIGNVHWLDAMTPPLEGHIRRLAKNIQTILAREDTVTEETGAFIAAKVAEWDASGRGAKSSKAAAPKDVAPAEKSNGRSTMLNVLVGILSVLVVVLALMYFLRKPTENPAPPPVATSDAPSTTPKPRNPSSGAVHTKTPAAPQQTADAPKPVATQQQPAATPPVSTTTPVPTPAPVAAPPPSTNTPPVKSAPPPAATPPGKDDAKSPDANDASPPELHQADALADKGDYNAAIAKYRDIIHDHPNNALAHTNLSNALRLKGDLDGAIAEAKDAIRLKPNLPVAHTAMGMALLKKGDVDGAIAQYHETIRLKPDLPNVHNLLGLALVRKNDWDDAIKEYRESIRINPENAEVHSNLGKALQAKGLRREANHEFAEAHRLDPKFSQQ